MPRKDRTLISSERDESKSSRRNSIYISYGQRGDMNNDLKDGISRVKWKPWSSLLRLEPATRRIQCQILRKSYFGYRQRYSWGKYCQRKFISTRYESLSDSSEAVLSLNPEDSLLRFFNRQLVRTPPAARTCATTQETRISHTAQLQTLWCGMVDLYASYSS